MAPKVLLLRLKPSVFDDCAHPIGFRPPCTLKYIESILVRRRTNPVKCLDQRITKLTFQNILELANEWQPKIVVMSISSLELAISVDFCRHIRASRQGQGTVIIATGQLIGSDLEQYARFNHLFDLALAGEAELEVISIIDQLNQGQPINQIKRLMSQSELRLLQVVNLDQLPFPIYDSQSLRGYSFVYPLKLARKLIWGHILATRGCVHHCIFCTHILRESYGRKLRVRSPGNVVDEIDALIRQGANIISFDDDNFTGSAEYVRSICSELKSRGLSPPWIAHARVDELNESLLKEMQQAGCVLLRLGIESGSPRVLSTLRKSNNPSSWNRIAKQTVQTARTLGIGVVCLFIVGNPGETKAELQQSIELAKMLAPDMIQVSYFTLFPDALAYTVFRQQAENLPVTKMYHYQKPLINLSRMDEQDFKRAQVMFYKEFLLRPAFLVRHLLNSLPFYITNPDVFFKLLKFAKMNF